MDDELGNTGGSANQTTMLEALRSCIAEARTDLRPYFTRTVEIAKSCEGRGICLKDVFCAVIGDSKHRRQLEVTFRDGSGRRGRRSHPKPSAALRHRPTPTPPAAAAATAAPQDRRGIPPCPTRLRVVALTEERGDCASNRRSSTGLLTASTRRALSLASAELPTFREKWEGLFPSFGFCIDPFRFGLKLFRNGIHCLWGGFHVSTRFRHDPGEMYRESDQGANQRGNSNQYPSVRAGALLHGGCQFASVAVTEFFFWTEGLLDDRNPFCGRFSAEAIIRQ